MHDGCPHHWVTLVGSHGSLPGGTLQEPEEFSTIESESITGKRWRKLHVNIYLIQRSDMHCLLASKRIVYSISIGH